MKIYRIESDLYDNSSFLEMYEDVDKSIRSLAIRQNWQPFTHYAPPQFELHRSETGKRNYKFDFTSTETPLLIFSEHAATMLHDILAPRGQFLDIITPSKRKKYIGYYPTNCLKQSALDLEKSDYDVFPSGLLVYKPVLKAEKITDDYLFTVEEDFDVFVTEKFKQVVEENKLVGFEFSDYNEIELS